jgi:hypothetical protein
MNLPHDELIERYCLSMEEKAQKYRLEKYG